MKEATLIYPHQLFAASPALAPGRPVFLVEEPLFYCEFPVHRQKLLFHYLSLRTYADELRAAGYEVTILPVTALARTGSAIELLAAQGVTRFHCVDTTDDWLEQRLAVALGAVGAERVWYESPLFLLPRAEAKARYENSKRHLARFYQSLRRDRNILMTPSGQPEGGKWSFDAENRKRLPSTVVLPPDPVSVRNEAVAEAEAWLRTVPGEQYGEVLVWLPYTRPEATAWLADFVATRLAQFGPYEDAMTSQATRLFHSALSPLLNVGLLTPGEVLAAVLETNAPVASREGFVRQILGWREFIRAAYEVDGRRMRSGNFFGHTRPLPPGIWTGETGLLPVDQVVKRALAFGYTHHIERLMVVGNFLLLWGTHPDQVYRWFMGLYVDAYDWVMVPNVYGMSQFADGGLFATKPYISGSRYVRSMSDFSPGVWVDIWDGLYWQFIDKHSNFFSGHPRLGMMARLCERMQPARRDELWRAVARYRGAD
jgi:deoxyribodipyrimidine photolyase-related protein